MYFSNCVNKRFRRSMIHRRKTLRLRLTSKRTIIYYLLKFLKATLRKKDLMENCLLIILA